MNNHKFSESSVIVEQAYIDNWDHMDLNCNLRGRDSDDLLNCVVENFTIRCPNTESLFFKRPENIKKLLYAVTAQQPYATSNNNF